MGISITFMQGQDAYTISVLPDASTTNLHSESQLAFLGHSEFPNQSNTQVCLDAKLNCQNYISLEMENAEAYSPCIVDVDIENGNSGTPKNNDESKQKMKIEGPLIVSSLCVCILRLSIPIISPSEGGK